jgi:hypothetical protein
MFSLHKYDCTQHCPFLLSFLGYLAHFQVVQVIRLRRCHLRHGSIGFHRRNDEVLQLLVRIRIHRNIDIVLNEKLFFLSIAAGLIRCWSSNNYLVKGNNRITTSFVDLAGKYFFDIFKLLANLVLHKLFSLY